MQTLAQLTAAAVVPEYSVMTPELIAAREVLGLQHLHSKADLAKARKIVEAAEEADAATRAAYRVESGRLFDAADDFAQAYIVSALWTGVEFKHGDPRAEGDRALDFGPFDVRPETLRDMIADCAAFVTANRATIESAIATGKVVCGPDFDEWGRAGHDFWLTRNGHGAGFWDGDWPEPQAERLSEAAREFGDYDLAMGDDGSIGTM
ncbi:hypothetical protein KIKIMORA_04770 [Brevundimonas phage vB_BpoS-Kikimora]|uniref:Uncharacterized protein n=1 Tax=Brevundimonas phage vB_BpoS-Kikimora TaxID=2948601 RepID=A0A9E7SL41_9CAUD|nr:hypothetical protein KIKIMORA_04770 [Brevundimonas phage vB_BpoS-Kikimora]